MPKQIDDLESTVADRLQLRPDLVSRVLSESFYELHRRFRTYTRGNGDYIGEELRFELPVRTYFHLLGTIQVIIDRYAWDENTSLQYLQSAGTAENWGFFSKEVATWNSESTLPPLSDETLSFLKPFIASARDCAQQMLMNADYIRRELPAIQIAPDLATLALTCCDDLVGTKHDVVSELIELQDLSESISLNVLAVRIRRILSWLSEPIPRLHALVHALDPSNSGVQNNALAFILISESAVNVLRAYAEMADSANRLLRCLPAESDSAG